MTADALPVPRPKLVPLRIGLVLAVLLTVSAAIPAVTEIGLTGDPVWDPIVIALAIVTPAVALAVIVLVPFSWRGRRKPAYAVAALLLVSAVAALPVFFLPAGEVPAIALVVASVTIAVTLAAALLITVGVRGTTPR